MAVADLSKEQRDFLVLTTESGSPYHPFVKGLRRMLGLPEIVPCSKRGSAAGEIVEHNDADEAIVMHHHVHEDEQGPIYTKRIEALEVLFNGPKPAPKKDPPKSTAPKAEPPK